MSRVTLPMAGGSQQTDVRTIAGGHIVNLIGKRADVRGQGDKIPVPADRVAGIRDVWQSIGDGCGPVNGGQQVPQGCAKIGACVCRWFVHRGEVSRPGVKVSGRRSGSSQPEKKNDTPEKRKHHANPIRAGTNPGEMRRDGLAGHGERDPFCYPLKTGGNVGGVCECSRFKIAGQRPEGALRPAINRCAASTRTRAGPANIPPGFHAIARQPTKSRRAGRCALMLRPAGNERQWGSLRGKSAGMNPMFAGTPADIGFMP